MPAGIILIVIIAFIGNRLLGLYKDETTTQILEESGAIRPRSPNARAGGVNQARKGAKLTPYQIQFQKDRAILARMAARGSKRILRKYGLEG